MASSAAPAEAPLDRRRYPDALRFSRWDAADGWPHRAYRWAARDAAHPRGSLLFQSGRGDFVEKYLEVCEHWWRLGWDVEGFDWRGQGGSGRLFPGVASDHRLSFDPLVDDLAGYYADWQARTPGPHVVVAHSMGGYVALRTIAERGLAFDAIVLVAPMLALNVRPIPLPVAQTIAWVMTHIGFSTFAARRERLDDPGRQKRLTADRERYLDSQWWKQHDPSLGRGGPSWGWIAAALKGDARLDTPGLLEKVTAPVQILVAGQDRLVDERAVDAAARRLPDVRVQRFPTAAHEILREADADRLAALAAIDNFFDAKAPRP